MTPATQETLMNVYKWTLILTAIGMVVLFGYFLNIEYKRHQKLIKFNSKLKKGDKAQLLIDNTPMDVEVLSLTDDTITISMEIRKGVLHPSGTYVKTKRGNYKRVK